MRRSAMKISLPDGSVREFEKGTKGFDVAMSISEGLARAAVAVKVNGEARDLHLPIEEDAAVELLTLRNAEGMEIYRHSSAHIMALAVKRLFPDVKLAIGPVVEDGFYYDFDEAALKEILDENGLAYVEAGDEAAFYGPKLDIQMKNVWGKEDTVITVQIDFALPERFGLTYIDGDGSEKTPMVIHRSSIGCYERTMALLIERYGGKFPFWLSPE